MPGVTALRQAGAGHPDRHPGRAARNTSTRWSAPMPAQVQIWSDSGWPSGCGATPALRNVAAETQNGGLRAHHRRSTARRPGGSASRCRTIDDTLNDAFGAAADLDHLRPVEPVPGDPGGRARNTRPTRPCWTSSTCRARAGRPATTARPAPRGRRTGTPRCRCIVTRLTQHRAAVDRPPGAVSRRHAQLRSRRRALARRGGGGDRPGRAGHRHAGLGHRQLQRRRGGVQQVAGGRAAG